MSITHPELGAHCGLTSGCPHLLLIVSAADLLKQVVDEVQPEKRREIKKTAGTQLSCENATGCVCMTYRRKYHFQNLLTEITSPYLLYISERSEISLRRGPWAKE